MLVWNENATFLKREDYVICYSSETGMGIRLLPEYYENLNSVIKYKVEEKDIPDCFSPEDQKDIELLVSSLINKRILVKKGEKEDLHLKEVTLILTNRCNFSCLHCCQDALNAVAEETHEMSFAEICRIIDKLVDLKVDGFLISGGEPMLHPDFFKIIKYLTQLSHQ